jgi:uncharacterized protein YjiS (DUF1127 family)
MASGKRWENSGFPASSKATVWFPASSGEQPDLGTFCADEGDPTMFETLIERIKLWARIQSGIEVLRGFDDRRLADMGIERELIPQIARTGVKVTHAALADEAYRQAAPHYRGQLPANDDAGNIATSRCPSVPA